MPNGKLFDVKVLGVRDAKGRFHRCVSELGVARREEMREMGRKVVKVLREEAPIRTGKLRAGIHFRTSKETPTRTELAIYSKEPYTQWVIRGRGPVVAIRARALRFEPGPPGSGFIFRKRVGPAKANPFQARAFARLQPEPLMVVRRISARITRAYSYA